MMVARIPPVVVEKSGWIVRHRMPSGEFSYAPTTEFARANPSGAICPRNSAMVYPQKWFAQEMAAILNEMLLDHARTRAERRYANRYGIWTTAHV